MEQHAVPRQITTFEFKLIGFFTVKQFGYLAFFSILGFVVYGLVPVPLLNIFCGVVTALVGVVIVFVPINDRPFDVWVGNFIKRLVSPSQYYFHKKNEVPVFLHNVFAFSDPRTIETHVDAQEKLSAYMQKKQEQSGLSAAAQKQTVYTALNAATVKQTATKTVPEQPVQKNSEEKPTPIQTAETQQQSPKNQQTTTQAPPIPQHQTAISRPFLHGLVKNSKDIPIPNVLVYVKDQAGQILRILKTNHHGVFATYHPLPPQSYAFELKDADQRYFFDTMEYAVSAKNETPLLFYSRELL